MITEATERQWQEIDAIYKKAIDGVTDQYDDDDVRDVVRVMWQRMGIKPKTVLIADCPMVGALFFCWLGRSQLDSQLRSQLNSQLWSQLWSPLDRQLDKYLKPQEKNMKFDPITRVEDQQLTEALREMEIEAAIAAAPVRVKTVHDDTSEYQETGVFYQRCGGGRRVVRKKIGGN